MNDFIIERLTDFFKNGLEEQTEDNIDILRDGITFMVLNISKTLVLFLIAKKLKMTKSVLFVFTIYGLIRNFSKGIHAKTSLSCLLIGLVNYIGIAYASKLIKMPITLYGNVLKLLLKEIYIPAKL